MDGCIKYLIIMGLCIFGLLYGITYIEQKRSYDGMSGQMAQNLSLRLKVKNLNNITVAPFSTMDGRYNKLGNYLSDNITSKLLKQSNNLNIIDRSKLTQLLDENDLLLSGLINSSTANQIGKLIGINAIVIGKFNVEDNWISQDRISISVQAVDLELGTIIFSDDFITNYDDNLESFED